MSLDGFIAGPDDAMDWIFEYVAPDEFPEVITATGAVLAGRRTYEVGKRDAGKVTGEAYGGAWSGPQFALTHEPHDDPADSAITFLAGDIGAAVDTALAAARGKNVEIFGADVARQCLERGLVDEIPCTSCRYYSATAPASTRLRPPHGSPWSRSARRSRVPSRHCGFASSSEGAFTTVSDSR